MRDTFYPRVKKMLDLSHLPDNLYKQSAWGHSRVWDKQARAAGYTPEAIDGIWNWDVVRKESRFWNRRSATVGESNHGNANGAKFDVTQNYLKYAEESGFTKVYSGTQVKGISQDANGIYLVEVEQMDPMGEILDKYTSSCGRLFMAAGSIGTTELLLRARERGDLPKLNEHVGEGWGTNGDAALFVRLHHLGALHRQLYPPVKFIMWLLICRLPCKIGTPFKCLLIRKLFLI